MKSDLIKSARKFKATKDLMTLILIIYAQAFRQNIRFQCPYLLSGFEINHFKLNAIFEFERNEEN